MKTENHKIARIIVRRKHYNSNGYPYIDKLVKVVEKFIDKAHGKQEFEFVITAGGFLKFKFPKILQEYQDINEAEETLIPQLCKEADKTIKSFLKTIHKRSFQKLQGIAQYITFGIDGINPSNDQRVELVALFDLKKEKVINWTGKFYPVEIEKRKVIKVNDLQTHFVILNSQNIIILGCHDLNVFSARGQATAKRGGWKRKKADEFKRICRKFEPDIILQHPHTTFSPRIWSGGWSGVMKEFPNLKHYASGINHKITREGNTLRPLDKVLDATKKGDVIDFK